MSAISERKLGNRTAFRDPVYVLVASFFYVFLLQGISYAKLANLPPIVGLCKSWFGYNGFASCYFLSPMIVLCCVTTSISFDWVPQTLALFHHCCMLFLGVQDISLLDPSRLRLLSWDPCWERWFLQSRSLFCFCSWLSQPPFLLVFFKLLWPY